MIILDTTTRKLQAVMNSAATTTNPDYVIYYVDITTSGFTPGSSNGTLNGTTPVDILVAPASSTYRQVKGIVIQNTDTVSQTITLRYNDNGTVRKISVITLATGYKLNIDSEGIMQIFDANGVLQVSGGGGTPNLTSSTGIVAQTASNTYSARTITGTSNEITITNGDGVSGNPTLALSTTVDLTGHTVNVKDSTFSIKDDSDATKITQFQCSGITTGTTRTLTVPNASGTIALTTDIPSAAAQSDQETSTSTTTYVSPGRQQYHPSSAKAWIKYNTRTTTSTLASYNIASLTDNGTGDTTVTYTTSFSSTNYSVSGSTDTNLFVVIFTFNTGTCRIQTMTNTSVLNDCVVCLSLFGDQ